MGNTQTSEANRKLGVPIIGKLESSLSKSTSDRGSVLGCYILYPDNTIQNSLSLLFHVILVTPRAIEMYCLLSGERRHPRYFPPSSSTIVASVLSREYFSSTHIITAESNGGFAVINAYSLTVDKRVGLSQSLPSLNAAKNVIFTMIPVAPEVIYVGYLSGVVKVWHTEVANPQFVFGKEYEQPPVRSIAFSSKYRKVVVGYEGTFQNEHGRFVKVEKNVLRVYTTHASGDSEDGVLEGFNGTCFAVSFIEKMDLVLAISSEESGLYAWNIESFQLIMKINLPKFDKHPQVVTQMLVIERPESNYLVLGTSDGFVIISEVVKEEDLIVWKPIKKLVMHLDGNYAIEFMRYEEKIDTLILGNTYATATLISDFFSKGLNQELSVHSESKIDL